MSARRALALATVQTLQLPLGTGYGHGLGVGNANCMAMFDGRPPATCGKWFLSVHQADRSTELRTVLQDRFSLNLTLTMRVNEQLDNVGAQLIELADTGFDARLDAIRACIWNNQWLIVSAANVILGADPSDPFGTLNGPIINGFCESIIPAGDPATSEVNESWFQAERKPKIDYHSPPFVGIKATLPLKWPLRIQDVGSAVA